MVHIVWNTDAHILLNQDLRAVEIRNHLTLNLHCPVICNTFIYKEYKLGVKKNFL